MSAPPVLVVTINDTSATADMIDDPYAAATKKHAGHDDQHAQMFLVLVGSLILMQFGLLYLRHQRPRAFHALSFLGLWAVPALLSAQTLLYHTPTNTFGYWRFLFVWAAFSVAQAVVVVRLVNQRPLLPTTPRFVYRWFQRHYQVCYAIGITGYALLVCDFLGLSILLPESQEPALKKFHIRNPWFFDSGVVLLFYGVYFGMLSRDLIETLSEQMAASIGYYNKDGLPSKHLRENICALCGDRVALADGGRRGGGVATSRPHLHGHSDDTADDLSLLIPATRLPCLHSFHEPCLKGWLLVGKKSTCPYCKEKVDTSKYRGDNPWDTQQVMYLTLLDWARWFLVWQPLVFLLAKFGFYLFDLD